MSEVAEPHQRAESQATLASLKDHADVHFPMNCYSASRIDEPTLNTLLQLNMGSDS